MPTPAIALRFKKFRRRFGIAAPRVTVHGHWGWPWYLAAGLLLFVLVWGVVWGLGSRSSRAQMAEEIQQLRGRQAALEQELLQMQAKAGTGNSAVAIERSAQQQLMARIRELEAENAGLKEDMAFFERLIPAGGGDPGVRIDRFQVIRQAEPGRLRYRLVVSYQAGKQGKEFHGQLGLVVTWLSQGREYVAHFPDAGDNAADFSVDVRTFLRKEGSLVIPANVEIKQVEARILQGDSVKARKLTQL